MRTPTNLSTRTTQDQEAQVGPHVLEGCQDLSEGRDDLIVQGDGVLVLKTGWVGQLLSVEERLSSLKSSSLVLSSIFRPESP